jgi:tetratricopeptide (TPR) repeat protein
MTDPGELERQLEAACRAIEEIDEDLRAGRLSEKDHGVSRKRAEAHAAQLLARQGRHADELARETDAASTRPRRDHRRRQRVIAATAAVALLAGIGIGVVIGRAPVPAARDSVIAVPPSEVGPPRIAAAPGTSLAPGMAAMPTVGSSPIAPGAPAQSRGGGMAAPTTGVRRPGASTTRPGSDGAAVPPAHLPMTAAPPALVQPTAAPSPRLQALDKEANAENAPIAKVLAFARLALEEKHRGPALAAYKSVLSRDPRNAEAIAGIGVILHDGQFIDQALARFDQALAIDPKLAQAHWHRAQILFEAKREYAEAARAGAAFLALVSHGDDSDRARVLVAEARRRAGAQPVANAPAGGPASAAPSPAPAPREKTPR